MFKKLYRFLDEKSVFVITSPHGLRYFTGFSGGEGIGVIGLDCKVLITDSRYSEEAEKYTKDFEIKVGAPYHIFLKEILIKYGKNKIFYEDSFLTVETFERIKESLGTEFSFSGASSITEKIREIKEEYEIDIIRISEKIAADTYKYILNIIKEGLSEIELASEIEYQMKKGGAQKTSFDTIVLSGARTSMPHGMPSNKKISKGDLITMDFGCIYNGYCSDMTRTVILGKASSEQRKIYNTVLNAQLHALENISAGKIAKDIDSSARIIIEKAGYGNYFGHSLGHGTGLLIHESPNVSPRSEKILEENMVISCEPGIYIPGFGGVRIEDLVVVKNNGIENLTTAEKKFTEI